MKASRSIRRKKEQEERKRMRKENKDKLSTVSNTLDSMPKKCDECEVPFDKTDIESCSKWRLAVYDSGKINLVCPECSNYEENH